MNFNVFKIEEYPNALVIDNQFHISTNQIINNQCLKGLVVSELVKMIVNIDQFKHDEPIDLITQIIQSNPSHKDPYFITGAVISLYKVAQQLDCIIPEVEYNTQLVPIRFILEKNGYQVIVTYKNEQLKHTYVKLSHNQKTKHSTNIIYTDLVPFRIDYYYESNEDRIPMINHIIFIGEDCVCMRPLLIDWDQTFSYNRFKSIPNDFYIMIPKYLKCVISEIQYKLYGGNCVEWLMPSKYQLYRDGVTLSQDLTSSSQIKLGSSSINLPTSKNLINLSPICFNYKNHSVEFDGDKQRVQEYDQTHTISIKDRTFKCPNII